MQEYYRFLKKYRTRRFKKGELIFVQGEVPDCTYVIKDGAVKTYNMTLSGEQRPIGFVVAPEIFPTAWIFGKSNHVLFYFEAFTDTEVYCVPVDQLLDFIATNLRAQAMLIDSLITIHVNTHLRINALQQSKASQKVLSTIHFLCLRYGVEEKNRTVRIKLPLTQQDLANFIGLTRETTGIELKRLIEKGIIKSKKQTYTVKMDKLNKLLDEYYGLGKIFEKAAAQMMQQPSRESVDTN